MTEAPTLLMLLVFSLVLRSPDAIIIFVDPLDADPIVFFFGS